MLCPQRLTEPYAGMHQGETKLVAGHVNAFHLLHPDKNS